MPLRPFGFPTYSVQSRFTVETLIMDPATDMSGADPAVIERVRNAFIDRLYGPGAAEVRPRPLLRLSIVEIEALATIALDVCSTHTDDPDAAERDALDRLQRKRSGRTIFGLVEGPPIEALGRDIIMRGRIVLTDPGACIEPSVSATLYDPQGLVVDPDDHDDIIDGGFQIIMSVYDPADDGADAT